MNMSKPELMLLKKMLKNKDKRSKQ